jgi:hypothetical protein
MPGQKNKESIFALEGRKAMMRPQFGPARAKKIEQVIDEAS